MNYQEFYGEEYYRTSCGNIPYDDEHFLHFFQIVAENIVNTIHPQTVLDVGCAFGYLVAALRDKGVEAYGIDVSEYAISQVRDDIKPYCKVCSALDPLPEEFPKTYGLVTNIEVAEHLYEEDGQYLIKNLCNYSDHILFSSTPDDFAEKTHFNVQQPAYWAKRFAAAGFLKDLTYDASYISPNAFLFSKNSKSPVRLVEDYERAIKLSKNITAEREKEIVRLNDVLTKKEEQIVNLQKASEEKGQELLQSEQRLKEYSDKNSRLQEILNERNLKICDLHNEAVRWQVSYQTVAGSTCWKVTKPVRVVLDELKKTSHISHIKPCLKKGFKSLKQYGIRGTWDKVIYKLSTEKKYRKQRQNANLQFQNSEELKENIKISILVPLYNTEDRLLREMIKSVKNQTYQNWELCLADGSDEKHQAVGKICREFSEKDSRILYQKLEKNLGISCNTNKCAKMASGDYLALLDHDDLLYPNALYENCLAIQTTMADICYSDEDKVTEDGSHHSPFYKPDWSPDLLYAQMYICHFLVFRTSLFTEIGGFNSEFNGSQDYDLMLRLSEKSSRICHIPQVLYSWRETQDSTSANAEAKPYAHIAGLKALDAHLKRRYGDYAYAAETRYTFVYEPRFRLLQERPLLSIVIPMKDHAELTENCIDSILQKTKYTNYEILLLDNRSEQLKTKIWLESVVKKDDRIHVYEADFDFNWSKINNFGIEKANGCVYVFLNNDTQVISPDWLERLAENALRKDIGLVGAQLLYENNTIQHAGVVVGLNGWADHVFKGMQAVHYGSPFVSPAVNRNVLAVTGACMAVSRSTIEKIGCFDESFIVCGSDVEICIRAYENGLLNLYDAQVQLYHLESKSRDNLSIPEVDFERSKQCYQYYWENGDPFFNPNLSLRSTIPQQGDVTLDVRGFKNYLKRNKMITQFYRRIKSNTFFSPEIPEVKTLNARAFRSFGDEKRINLLVPSVNVENVFGGISTALKFYKILKEDKKVKGRIIVTDDIVRGQSAKQFNGYRLVDKNEDDLADMQIVDMSDRHEKTIPVAKNDLFIATGWWTAYLIAQTIKWQSENYQIPEHELIYLIQDFEPGFYPWSSRYLMADSTYKLSISTNAVFNSKELKEYFNQRGYSFKKEFFFAPTLNPALKNALEKYKGNTKEKVILIYGRPSTPRNAFEMIVAALKEWAEKQPEADTWSVFSAGEKHPDVNLGKGCILHSVGKLSLDEYAQLMSKAYIGISLMASPHPSYPPLEMCTFGMKVITNQFANKDLSNFSKNITSLENCTPNTISERLLELCDHFSEQANFDVNEHYFSDDSDLLFIAQSLNLSD